MGRTRNKNDQKLGQSLLRKREANFSISTRHTTADDAPATVTSITENTSLEEFLTNAEASQRTFEAERGRAAIAVCNIS